jgi:anti-anti-sigma factor
MEVLNKMINIKSNNNQLEVIINKDLTIQYSNTIKRQILDNINCKYNKIILNFKKVQEIDSSGIAKLLLLKKRLNNNCNINIKITKINKKIERKFNLIQFNKIFNIN